MSSLESFKASFKGDIVTQADAGYEAAIARWAANAVRRAKIVAFVKDESDVAAAIKYAQAEKLPIAVKGGGHSASGTSSQTDGLVIDYTSTVGIHEPTGAEASQSGRPGGITASGNNDEPDKSSKAGSSRGSIIATATSTGTQAGATGSASSMSPAQAFSLFTALLAVIAIGG